MGARAALYLALDQGGQSSRALVFDAQGRIAASAAVPVTTQHPAPDRVEQDPQELTVSLRRAAESALTQLGEDNTHIVAAGLATQRSNVVCWDRASGAALTPVLSWQDRRAANVIDGVVEHAGDIRMRTGLVLSPHYGASKLRWCLDHVPAVTAAAQAERLAFGPLASYLLYRLLEERPLWVDPSNAARTLLWNLRDEQWDTHLLALFGLPRAPLPQCVASQHAYGTLRVNGQNVPLTVLIGDQAAALFGYGPPLSGTVYVNLGTGAFLQSPSRRLPPLGALLSTLAYRDDKIRYYVQEGTVNGAGSALQWLAAQHASDPQALIAQLPLWLESIAEPPLFINSVAGLGSPYWVADLTPRFIGTGDLAAQAVAVIESIVFLLHSNLVALSSEAAPQRIVVSGGLSQLDGLCQRLADIAHLPVQRPAAVEATARGLACLLAGRSPRWDSHASGIGFTPRDNTAFSQRHARFRAELRLATHHVDIAKHGV